MEMQLLYLNKTGRSYEKPHVRECINAGVSEWLASDSGYKLHLCAVTVVSYALDVIV
jgi:hypothetical protein